LNREALVLRNRSMTETLHRLPLKHYLRRVLLRSIAQWPISPGKLRGGLRILLIRPDHLGDVLLTVPAICALRRALPQAEIHALVGPWSAAVLANYPELDRVLTMPFPGFARDHKQRWRSPYAQAIHRARQLRQIGYSSAVILRPDHWWGAMLAYLAGIPERIGYNLDDVTPFLTQPVNHQQQHAVLKNLCLVESWTGPVTRDEVRYNFPVHERDRAYVDGYLKEWEIPASRPILCIHPGSGTWVKRWDPARWAVVADTLIDQLGLAVVFTGGDHELAIVREINARMQRPACIMVGDTQVGQLAALFARAQVVLGPDSGPMHLAAAVGTPTVTLFGPADPVEFAPWGSHQHHHVLTSDIGCRPCGILDWGSDNPDYHPCVREITVGRVLEAARSAISSSARPDTT
jgi:lipopolysaccharide heptosyltransferase II